MLYLLHLLTMLRLLMMMCQLHSRRNKCANTAGCAMIVIAVAIIIAVVSSTRCITGTVGVIHHRIGCRRSVCTINLPVGIEKTSNHYPLLLLSVLIVNCREHTQSDRRMNFKTKDGRIDRSFFPCFLFLSTYRTLTVNQPVSLHR
jgi:hypothetical protein